MPSLIKISAIEEIFYNNGLVLTDHEILAIQKMLEVDAITTGVALRSYLKNVLTSQRTFGEKFPFESLVNYFKVNGFILDTATVLSLQTLLLSLDLSKITMREFKDYLRPLVCKNEEQQKLFDRVYDAYVNNRINEIQVKNHQLEDLVNKLNGIKVSERSKVLIKRITHSLVTAVLLSLFIWVYLKYSNNPVQLKISAPSQAVVGDTITIKALILPKRNLDQYNFHWKFKSMSGSIIEGKDSVLNFVPRLAETHEIYLTATDKKKKDVAQDSTEMRILCEQLPSVKIESSNANPTPGSQVKFQAITNNFKPTGNYEFNWTIDKKFKVHQPSFLQTFNEGHHEVRLEVSYQPANLHCSNRKLEDVFEFDAQDLIVNSFGEPLPIREINWASTFLWCSIALFSLTIVSWLVTKLLRSPIEKLPPPGKESPYSIEFSDQSKKIETNQYLQKVANSFSRRCASEYERFDFLRSIIRSARAAGFPSLVFKSLLNSYSYVILVDYDLGSGHKTQLFRYLVQFLRQSQVELYLYSFYGDPTRPSLYGESIVTDPEKIVARLPQSNLIIFSESDGFFKPYTSTLLGSISKLKGWNNRTLITPKPKFDWGAREEALKNEGFAVIPAEPIAILKRFDFNSTEADELLRETTRFADFNTIQGLRVYLNSEFLEDWVFALSVYPRIDWSLTLAIGSAIREYYDKNNKPALPVDYTTLLKLARIEWLNDNTLPDRLRAEMLEKLSNEIENLAREKVQSLLDEFGSTVTKNSFVKDHYEAQSVANSYVLNELSNKASGNVSYKKFKKTFGQGNIDWTTKQHLKQRKFKAHKRRIRNESLVSYSPWIICFILALATCGFIVEMVPKLLVESSHEDITFLITNGNKLPYNVDFNLRIKDTSIAVVNHPRNDSLRIKNFPAKYLKTEGTIDITWNSDTIAGSASAFITSLGLKNIIRMPADEPKKKLLEIRYNAAFSTRKIADEEAKWNALGFKTERILDRSITGDFFEAADSAIANVFRQNSNGLVIKLNQNGRNVRGMFFQTPALKLCSRELPSELNGLWEDDNGGRHRFESNRLYFRLTNRPDGVIHFDSICYQNGAYNFITNNGSISLKSVRTFMGINEWRMTICPPGERCLTDVKLSKVLCHENTDSLYFCLNADGSNSTLKYGESINDLWAFVASMKPDSLRIDWNLYPRTSSTLSTQYLVANKIKFSVRGITSDRLETNYLKVTMIKQAPESLDGLKIIEGEGIGPFKIEKTTINDVIKLLGSGYQEKEHGIYSTEIVYSNLGLSFYYLQGDINRKLLSIYFFKPFKGQTTKGVELNQLTIEDVAKVYGPPKYTTCEGCDYWDASYYGIQFRVIRDKSVQQFPLNTKNQLKMNVNGIMVSLNGPGATIEEMVVKSLEGTAKMPDINKLDLSATNLTQIPKEIFDLKNLKELNLEYNLLSSKDFDFKSGFDVKRGVQFKEFLYYLVVDDSLAIRNEKTSFVELNKILASQRNYSVYFLFDENIPNNDVSMLSDLVKRKIKGKVKLNFIHRSKGYKFIFPKNIPDKSFQENSSIQKRANLIGRKIDIYVADIQLNGPPFIK